MDRGGEQVRKRGLPLPNLFHPTWIVEAANKSGRGACLFLTCFIPTWIVEANKSGRGGFPLPNLFHPTWIGEANKSGRGSCLFLTVSSNMDRGGEQVRKRGLPLP